MSNELHQNPETRVEKKDQLAITDPRQQKNLATNQGVRFYVDQETRLLEQALHKTMTGQFQELNNRLVDLGKSLNSANVQITDLLARLNVLELRWYERLIQDFEWDWLHIREWFFKRFGWGSDPFSMETMDREYHVSLSTTDQYEEIKAVLEMPKETLE